MMANNESVMERLLKEVRIGDLVVLDVDGNFFERHDDCDDKYAGYVCELDPMNISLSPTHHTNKYHGYSPKHSNPDKRKEHPDRVSSSIELGLVRKYRIIP